MQPGTTFKGGVIDRRIKERIIDYNKHAKNSHILKYSREEGHSHVGTKFSKYLEKITAHLSIGRLVKLYS